MDGKPANGKYAHHNDHHTCYPFLSTKGLPGGACGRGRFPETEEHAKVKETDYCKWDGVGGEHETDLERGVIVVLTERANSLIFVCIAKMLKDSLIKITLSISSSHRSSGNFRYYNYNVIN